MANRTFMQRCSHELNNASTFGKIWRIWGLSIPVVGVGSGVKRYAEIKFNEPYCSRSIITKEVGAAAWYGFQDACWLPLWGPVVVFKFVCDAVEESWFEDEG